jgi:hypothetical protein
MALLCIMKPLVNLEGLFIQIGSLRMQGVLARGERFGDARSSACFHSSDDACRLTEAGITGALKLKADWESARPSASKPIVASPRCVDVVLVSPLTRALQTASVIFEGAPLFQAIELCREAHGCHPVSAKHIKSHS